MLNNIVALLGNGSGGAAGSFESIATVTATGSETSLTFSSIPSTYKALQIRGLFRQTANTNGSQLYLQYNGNTSGYTRHVLLGNATAAVAAGATSQSAITLAYQTADGQLGSSYYSAIIVDIQDYASTSKNKTVRAFFGADGNGVGTYDVGLTSGFVADLNAISTITLTQYSSNAFASGSTFALYGIKGE